MASTNVVQLRRGLVTMATLLCLGLFLSLGNWQLQRGYEKAAIERSVAQNREQLQQLPQLPLADSSAWRNKRVSLSGHYDSSKQFLLDNQIRGGRVGYNVLTPFYLEISQAWVLVDRGWLPQGVSREQLPTVAVDTDEQTIIGAIYVPYAKAYSLGEIAEGEDYDWPRRVQFIDFIELGKRLEIELQPFTLRLSAEVKDGFRRDWQSSQMPAMKHYGYAFQWFAMAAAVVILWYLYSFRKKKTT
ncbi:MAG: SURF1 family protein [Gammaproteobacteria bacterium]|nr:SURF1 family protein [Gammaproteobacteria bacterium]